MRLKETEMLNELTRQAELYLPLTIKSVSRELFRISIYSFNALIGFSIQGGPSFTAVAEVLTLSTPKKIDEKSRLLKSIASDCMAQNWIPMIVAPYISEKQSMRLREEGISWIDLSGNMRIQASPAIYIERTGKPNKYPDSSPIKNIYKGTSSLVARALLLKPDGFSSLYEVVNFINARNGTITLATVSKVITSLEENLLVDKGKGKIRVKQPATLLDNLAQGYSEIARRQKNQQIKYNIENCMALPLRLFNAQLEYAFCGFYAAKLKGLGVTDQMTLFVKSFEDVQKAFRLNPDVGRPDEEYGQVTFIEAVDPCVWFNLQDQPLEKIVDDLELYLEMANDTPRGPKIADQLKQRILGGFNG